MSPCRHLTPAFRSFIFYPKHSSSLAPCKWILWAYRIGLMFAASFAILSAFSFTGIPQCAGNHWITIHLPIVFTYHQCPQFLDVEGVIIWFYFFQNFYGCFLNQLVCIFFFPFSCKQLVRTMSLVPMLDVAYAVCKITYQSLDWTIISVVDKWSEHQ